jgi:hypothetical protein
MEQTSLRLRKLDGRELAAYGGGSAEMGWRFDAEFSARDALRQRVVDDYLDGLGGPTGRDRSYCDMKCDFISQLTP